MPVTMKGVTDAFDSLVAAGYMLPQTAMPQKLRSSWYDLLSEIEDRQLAAAIDSFMRSPERWWPTAGVILQIARELRATGEQSYWKPPADNAPPVDDKERMQEIWADTLKRLVLRGSRRNLTEVEIGETTALIRKLFGIKNPSSTNPPRGGP